MLHKLEKDGLEKIGYAPIHPAVQLALTILGVLVLIALLVYGFGDYSSVVAASI